MTPKPVRPVAISVTLLVLALLIAQLFLRREDQVTWSGRCMGVLTYEVKIARAGLRPRARAVLQQAVNQDLQDLNQQVSTYVADSEISRFNRHASTEPFPVSPAFAEMVRASLKVCDETDGAFDPTVGPLIDLWGFGAAGPRTNTPTAEAVASALARTGWRKLRVTERQELVKEIPDLNLNLSAIACGWAVDRIADRLRAAGLTNHYVNLSGEVACSGVNFQGKPWVLGIPNPRRDRVSEGELFRRVEVRDRGLATSGDYHNFYQDESGRFRSHILDPRAGTPVDHALCSASVLAPTSALADAYGTALMVMGLEKSLAWLKDRPGVEALLITRDGEELGVRATPGFPVK